MSALAPDSIINEVIALHAAGMSFEKIAEKLAKDYGFVRSHDTIRNIYNRYKNVHDVGDPTQLIKKMKQVARTQQANSRIAKENREALKHIITAEDILEQVGEMLTGLKKMKVANPKIAKSKHRTAMTMEALISDVHVGKKTEKFSLAVCKKRLRHFTEVFLGEYQRNATHYKVEKFLLSFLGDNLENSRMHGAESLVGCEFSNPEQIRWTIQLFLEEVIMPLAQLGVPMEIVAISGNHDRDGEKQTFHNPGKESFDWTIFKTLQMICDRMGLTHIKWQIPEGAYHVAEIYGNYYLLEHGHFIRGNSPQALSNHLANRSAQTGKILSGLRIGHWHTYTNYAAGRLIINGSVCGQDSYADVNGYLSEAGQTINCYVKTGNRTNPFFRSLFVQLDEIT